MILFGPDSVQKTNSQKMVDMGKIENHCTKTVRLGYILIRYVSCEPDMTIQGNVKTVYLNETISNG